MRHVFVETNRVYSFSAPAHHKVRAAVKILDRAREGEIRIHLPSVCLTEVRRPILTKCQPGKEADAIRQFLLWARAEHVVSPEQDQSTREVLVLFEQRVRAELRGLEDSLASLFQTNGLELFPLSERMLEKPICVSAKRTPTCNPGTETATRNSP